MRNKLNGHGMPIDEKLGFFENKTICIFGGTGTIGTLIVEYLIKQNPHSIRIFSNSENELWECQQKWGINPNLRYLLGDIRDYIRVKRSLNKVHYVFNCAAIKHVPFGEYNPLETIDVNIHGLENIINASIECGVEKLLQISTDKAVEPTTIMGASKMIGERLLQIRWSQNVDATDLVCVRLGNVWGSRGSIIPLARKLIEEGKPITITDPDMIRFFMRPKEVTDFIMLAFEKGTKGEIWVPKLHKVRLIDMIEKEFGKQNITIIGARKGEKMEERLLSTWEVLEADGMNPNYWIIKNTYPQVF